MIDFNAVLSNEEHDKAVFDLECSLVLGPKQLAKSGSEHAEQRAFFAWLNYLAFHWYPELEWCFAVPNGGKRGDTAESARIAGGMLKAEGVKSGVPDTMLTIPRFHVEHNCMYAGFFIEFKTKDGGDGGSENQHKWLAHLSEVGYATFIAHGWEQAARAIVAYMEYKRRA